jgi:lipopolysaccharide/colanic/teichoic acid biosynthesis glycosyltransferase
VMGAEHMLADLKGRNEADGPLFKMRDDPRVTRVGRFLRRYSLDELPQLWNVLKGEMSLVGPRPPLPREVEAYEDWQLDRLEARPGITGLWQVSGRSELPFDEYVRLDLFYIENWSLSYDLFILAKTIPMLLAARGAY